MTSVMIEAGTLTASRADRVVSGLLLPYGEVGRTNLGRFSVDQGAFTVPPDPAVVTFNRQHDASSPIGRAATLTDTPAGIVASFAVARTPEGDAYLDEVERGERNALSAEVADVVIRDGKAIGGRLFAAAAVTAGAFPSATLLAADAGELPDDELVLPADDVEQVVDALVDALDVIETETSDDDPSSDDAAGAADEEATVADTDTVTPADEDTKLKAGLPGSLSGASKAKAVAKTLFAQLGNRKPTESATLMAALDAIIPADALPAQQKQWLGEIYASRTYQRRFAPLIQHADLQALAAIGWKFTTDKTPVVADYAGYPAQPNSNEVKTEQVTLSASRLAGAGEVDRSFIDFPTPEFWAGYFREQTNSYERVLDAKVPALLTTSGNYTAVTADDVPDGVAAAASYIVDGAAAIIDAERGTPSFAIVGTGLWKGLLRTRSDDTLAYLSASLGLEDGTLEGFKIIPSSLAALTGKVLVGTKTSATLYELPGVPVRVDTVNIANGGMQRGLYGYWAGLINDVASLALVAPDED